MRIAFRFPRHVLVLGETSDWRSAIVVEGEREIELPVGVYQYKLVVDDVWQLDPENPRTRSDGGQRNSVLEVGGAPEPLLFAPGAPWVEALDRGGVRVLVGKRKPVAAPPTLAYREDESFVDAAMAFAFEEDEHVFYVATLPTSARFIGLRVDSFDTSWRRPPPSESTPAWWRSAAIYGIFVDRFRPAIDRDGWEDDPGKGVAAGGHLDGIRRSLGEIADLGFDTVYLTPVHRGASVHRYDMVDPLTVDPALGGEEAYDALVREARARGMRIAQDISFAHAGRGFPPYEEILRDGASSKYAAWFRWKDGALAHYGKRTDAPLFDLENEEVAALVLETVAYWARRGASALRLDMTAEVPLPLGRAIRSRFHELVPDGVVFGELVPLHAWRWRTAGVVDGATDFAFHDAMTALTTDLEASPAIAFERIARGALVRGGDATSRAVRFLSTHDHPRIATLAWVKSARARLPLAYAMLATMPGIPMLLYGEEAGMRSDGAGLELEDVWPDRAPMPWKDSARDHHLHAIVRSLFRARRASIALREGSLRLLFADATTLVYRREADGDVIDVALNFADHDKEIELDDDDLPRMTAIAGSGAVDGATIRIPGFGIALLRREPAAVIGRSRRNLALRDQEMKEGRVTLESRPTRFLFAVTERCNLRCEHCITHAPEKTATGAARTMTPAVLDALRDDLALGTYFAFVHGGESMTAPIFFDVLDAIGAARAGEPYVAHLLTNGLLLNPATADRLIRRGVQSISVSLDGATAATNDAIRLGGRFDDVTRRLADVLAWRRGEGIDLRIGLSYVVLGQNVRELDAFVDLGATLGVDWIKLEEGVPATPFAKRSLVSCDAPEIRAAIDAAIVRGRERGLVMVDHTRDRAVWRCKLDDETRAFLAADEFANRAEIHPCRTPWETICVEPNGDVRALDFHASILGNVTTTPLSTLWNANVAREARDRARLGRLCAPGPVTCL